MKSFIGEALKAISKREQMEKINVCECGAPLIFTMAFAYNEYLCLECGSKYGMMGVDSVESTKELKYKLSLYKKLWDVLYGKNWLLPRSRFGMQGCKKCTSDNHLEHLTEKEILKDKIATAVFEKLINNSK